MISNPNPKWNMFTEQWWSSDYDNRTLIIFGSSTNEQWLNPKWKSLCLLNWEIAC